MRHRSKGAVLPSGSYMWYRILPLPRLYTQRTARRTSGKLGIASYLLLHAAGMMKNEFPADSTWECPCSAVAPPWTCPDCVFTGTDVLDYYEMNLLNIPKVRGAGLLRDEPVEYTQGEGRWTITRGSC